MSQYKCSVHAGEGQAGGLQLLVGEFVRILRKGLSKGGLSLPLGHP